jgi:hypothetical protein
MQLGIYHLAHRDGKHYSLRNTNGSPKARGGFQQGGHGRARETITTAPGKVKERPLPSLPEIPQKCYLKVRKVGICKGKRHFVLVFLITAMYLGYDVDFESGRACEFCW